MKATCQSYIKVFFLSCAAPLLISGVISFLSDVSEILPVPDKDDFFVYARNGLACSDRVNGRTMECTQVTKLFANSNDTSISNICLPQGNLSGKTIYSLNTRYEVCVYSLYVFAALYGISLFIHDSTLLYHASKIKYNNNEDNNKYSGPIF